MMLLFAALLLVGSAQAQVYYQCNFETDNDFCGASNNGQLPWVTRSGGTPSGNTGPDSAMTGQSYAYMEASSVPQGAQAVLRTPSISFSGQVCLTFGYHMYGQHIGNLGQPDFTVSTSSNQAILSVTGQKQTSSADAWTQEQQIFNVQFGDSIIFTATRGTGAFGDIAIDDVRLVRGDCTGVQTTKTPTTTRKAQTQPTQGPTQPPGPNCPSSNNINFESRRVDECNVGAGQAQDDNMDWVLGNGPTPSRNTGPAGAQSGSYYIYIEASNRQPGNTARLEMARPSFSGSICVRWYYHMYGFHTGELQFYTENFNFQRQIVWYVVGQQQTASNSPWLQAAVDVNLNNVRRFGFIGIRAGGYSGDIALDAITYTSGSCESPQSGYLFQCLFESRSNPNLATQCGISQATNDAFDWTLIRGATPSLDTGPTSAFSSNYYIYMEASSPRTPGQQCKMLLPVLNRSGTLCLRFRYHMFGFHMGQLTVYRRTSGGSETEVWTRSGPQGNNWNQESVTITNVGSSDQIGFVGTVGTEYSSDIGLDNVEVQVGNC